MRRPIGPTEDEDIEPMINILTRWY